MVTHTAQLRSLFPGDVNGDGIVNSQDVGSIPAYWLETVPLAPANADVDGFINSKNISPITANWLKTA